MCSFGIISKLKKIGKIFATLRPQFRGEAYIINIMFIRPFIFKQLCRRWKYVSGRQHLCQIWHWQKMFCSDDDLEIAARTDSIFLSWKCMLSKEKKIIKILNIENWNKNCSIWQCGQGLRNIFLFCMVLPENKCHDLC